MLSCCGHFNQLHVAFLFSRWSVSFPKGSLSPTGKATPEPPVPDISPVAQQTHRQDAASPACSVAEEARNPSPDRQASAASQINEIYSGCLDTADDPEEEHPGTGSSLEGATPNQTDELVQKKSWKRWRERRAVFAMKTRALMLTRSSPVRTRSGRRVRFVSSQPEPARGAQGAANNRSGPRSTS